MRYLRGMFLACLIAAPAAAQAPLENLYVYNSPSDVASWSESVRITGVSMSRPGGIVVVAEIPDSWDYHVPGWGGGGDNGNVLYTVWVAVKADGLWRTSGFIQMWKGRQGTGAPILTDWNANWAYDSLRWGSMTSYHPQIGDIIGVMISAGNARGEKGVTSVRERSNMVWLNLPAGDTGSWTFLPPQPPAPVPVPVPVPAPPPTPAPAPSPAPDSTLADIQGQLAVIMQRLTAIEAVENAHMANDKEFQAAVKSKWNVVEKFLYPIVAGAATYFGVHK